MVRLGVEHALVVHSMDGLDEISLSAPTRACEVRDGTMACLELSPQNLGLPMVRLEDIRAETVAENADVIRSILAGRPGPHRDVVMANAAAALYVAGVAESVRQGVGRAAEAIDSGAAATVLEALVRLSNGPA